MAFIRELDKLALGRFTHGAVEIATEIQKHAMMRKFNELNQIKAKAPVQELSLK